MRKSVPDLPTPLKPQQILQFSWTHLIDILRLDDPWKRAFYENECLLGAWSVRQLQRQIGSQLYERTGLSKNKRAVVARARKQSAESPATIEDLIRDPYVLEFTGLADRPAYSENDLETALLNHVQSFLLELGTGFCFEARQFRITVGNEHDRIDLVFYHRRLRCHVLLDLKIRAFSHSDAGQIHPVRYSSYEQIQLRLHPPQSKGRRSLHRLYLRSAKTIGRAPVRCSAVHKGAATRRVNLLRGLFIPSGRNQAGKIPEDGVGQALP